MFWKKVYHHASFIFLALLLLAQGLVLVASQARPRVHYDLDAVFIEPTGYTSLAIGQSVTLQAKLSSRVANNFSTVYFTVANPDKNISLNFEANRQSDGSWLANSTWETNDWPAAIYQISATANVTDANGKLTNSLLSAPQLVQLIDLNAKALADNALSPASGDQPTGTKAAIDDALPLPLPVSHTTTTPTSTPTPTPTPAPTSPSVPTTTTPTVPTSTTPVSTDKKITLVSPANSSVISDSQLAIRLTTNFAAEALSVEFINIDNAAISTGSISITKVDGLNWNKTITLNNTFIGGNYKLLVSASPQNETSPVDAAFDFILAASSTESNTQDLAITLSNLGSNLSGPTTLKAIVSSQVSSAEFVVTNSLTDAEVLRASGLRKAADTGMGEDYLYTWDTKTVPNGNYFVYAQAHLDSNTVTSEKKLVSVFNETNVINPTTTSTPGPIGGLNNPSTSTPPAAPVAAGQLDCTKSGISDPTACAKFQAELSGSFPQACLDSKIYDAKACEDFLGQNQIPKECQDQKITDSGKCKDYLMTKYAGNVVCQLTVASTCTGLLRDNYLNRLVVLEQQQNILASSLSSLFGQTLSVSDLGQKLKDGGFLSGTSIFVSPEIKVMIARAQAETTLVSADQLSSVPPAILMPDSDGDLLPNDLEKYYGTDPNKVDTDGDGYTDGEEVKNGYNPLGPGKLTVARTALDQVILGGLNLEQPKESSLALDPSWQVKEATLQNGILSLSGQADPATWVNIYLYSGLPVLLTTETDASGQWSYNLSASLSEGVHQAYVAINDLSGKILKQSAGLVFSVSNLPAPTVTAPTTFTEVTPVKTGFQFVWWYFVIAGVFVLIIALAIILIVRRRKQAFVPDSGQILDQPADTQSVNTQTDSETPPDNIQYNLRQ